MDTITILHTKYDKPVKHIIHISDIHIRQGDIERSRYNEYKHVFNGFIQDIQQFVNSKKIDEDTIIVITGDVFHNKGKMDTPAIKLFFQWMDKMLNIAPVFIICGNHDFRQEDPHHPDMIEVLTVPYTKNIKDTTAHRVKYPLFYLKNTGQYIWQNIGFGLVSVKDTLRVFNTAGIISKLPDFPSADNLQNVDFKIALFHGTLLPFNTNELKNVHGYRLEWFNGYNAVLLGDNHVQQIHNDTIKTNDISHPIIWGYPGSLIQQNFGETPYGHGYILWTLNNDKTIQAECKHILNNYSLITVKKQKQSDDYNVYMSKKDILSISNAIKLDYFPKYPRIRVIGKTGEDDIVTKLFNQYNIEPDSIMVTIPIDDKDENIYDNEDDTQENVQFSIAQMSNINHTEKWIEFLNKSNSNDENETITMIESFINDPSSMKIDFENIDQLPKEIIQKIKTRNTKIESALQEYKDIRMQHHGIHHKIIFDHMYWDYVMCYGPSNYFDFKTLTGKVCLLNGRNAIGKSAFLDVLCIGLYGEPSKQRHMLTGKKMTGKMIHDHRPANVSMCVNIMFSMNDESYEIFRSFSQQAKEENWARPISATICSVNLTDNTKTIVCEGTLMVDEWISKRFGTLDDILMSTFVSQIETNNFFHLKQDEQKHILDKALHLESISAYASLLKEAILAHNDITNMLSNSKLTLNDLIQNRKNNLKDPSSLQSKINKYTSKLKDVDINLNKLLILIGNYDDLVKNSYDMTTIKKTFEKASKKLLTLEAITDDDKKHALMIQGEQKAEYYALRDEKNKLGEPTMNDISIQKIKEFIENLTNDIKIHNENKPLCNLSNDILNKQLNELDEWKLQQNSEWLENPDALETILIEKIDCEQKLIKKYNDCIQNSIQKPTPISSKDYEQITKEFIKSKDKWSNKDLEALKIKYIEVKQKWNELVQKIKIQPKRSIEDYKKWNIGYKNWSSKIAPVRDIDESLDDLHKKYNEYNTYVETLKNKYESQNYYKELLEQINTELEELDIKNLPFNPECWACKSLPTRKRFDQLNEKQTKITKDLQKVVKYFQKIPDFDLNKQLNTLEELKNTFDLRSYYENTYENIQTEYNEWQVILNEWKIWNKIVEEEQILSQQVHEYEAKIYILEYYLWEKWQVKEKTLKHNCDDIRNSIIQAQSFIKEYENYNTKYRFLEEESLLHNKYKLWESQLNELTNKLNDYNIEYQRKLLDEKFTKWQTSNNMRIDLVDKIKAYETLEKEIYDCQRIINYDEYKALLQEKQDLESKIKEYSNEYIRYEKELEDLEKIKENMSLYELYYSTLLKRKENLILLENRFIGEKNGDEGYKEWVYKQHVIPLIEKEINRFLSLIDTIRLKITYSNKSFQYMVIDRGNTPTLAMSSGYQRFIIGISLRLAFACIGATGQNIRHLFIDEGFVACDSVNLEKIQSMLHKMMEYGGYNNIILMSHLEAIRDAADLSVDIHREGLFSRIQWGTQYPRLNKITPDINDVKKRGRPKKSN